MSESNNEPLVKLSYDNWYIWDFQIKSTILRKNAYVAFDPEPVDPRAQQQVSPAGSTGSTTIPSITVSHTPTAEELKAYCEEHKEWKMARNITAGVILGSISRELQHIITPDLPAKTMYNLLKAKVIKQSSGSSANATRRELI